MKLQDICPRGASTKSGLGGLLAEDCHCCSQRALIFRFALVEMVANGIGVSGSVRFTQLCSTNDQMSQIIKEKITTM
jgi:hypothetical protein